MRKIGLVIAVEIDVFFSVLGKSEPVSTQGNIKIYKYNLKDVELTVCECGPGIIASAAATQHLISLYDVDMILNAGVAGGISKDVNTYDLCIAENLVHYEYDLTDLEGMKQGQYLGKKDIFFKSDSELIDRACELLPELKKVNLASGNRFVTDMKKRIELAEISQCQICDMEAAGVVITCRRNKVPYLVIKAISDSVNDGEQSFFKQENKAGELCFEAIRDVIYMA